MSDSQQLQGILEVTGAGTAGGTLHVEGTWEAPGPVGYFKVSGTLGGKKGSGACAGGRGAKCEAAVIELAARMMLKD
jgi:hypothetical protein